VAHALNENRVLKLKSLITSELGFPTYDIDDKLTKDLDVLIPYATRDTVATLMLANKYAALLKDADLLRVKKLYTNVTRPMDFVFTDVELKGWPVDESTCLELQKLVSTDLDRTANELRAMLADRGIETNQTTFGSPKQLAKIIFEDFGYPLNPDKRTAYTKTGGIATNNDALIHLKGKPFIDKILEWRGLSKMLSTYIEPMLAAARGRGRITTSYKLTGARTGRTASGKEKEGGSSVTSSVNTGMMNLQNLPYTTYGPKKLNVRHCIRARPGYSIMEADFSQIELRIAGEMSRDPLLIKTYQTGQDLHLIRAMRIMGVTPEEWEELSPEVRDEKRKKAKPANFGFIYGMEAPKYKVYALTNYGLDLSLSECHKTREQFFEDHYGLPTWYAKQERECERKGYVESLSGRRRHLPNIRMAEGDTGSREARTARNEAIRMAINTPVQGFASDLKLMSMIEIFKWIDPEEGYVFGEIHDSILLEVRNACIEKVGRKVLSVMEHPSILDKLGIELSVPICAEIKYGPSLGEAKKLKLAA